MKKFIYATILLVILLIVRLLCFNILWRLGKEEFMHSIKDCNNKVASNLSINFEGFSNYQRMISKLKKTAGKDGKEITVISYFDFIHPNVYLILNKNELIKMCFWTSENEIINGINEIYLYKFDYCKNIKNGKVKKEFYQVDGSFFSVFLQGFNNLERSLEIAHNISYTIYIKKIYFFYFLFPILPILLLTFFFGKSIFISLIYYIEMSILFLTREFWYSSIVLINSIVKLNAYLNILLLLFFITSIVFGFVVGIKQIKTKKFSAIEKMFVLFFILLPFFFRF